jgi:hypothetical protein
MPNFQPLEDKDQTGNIETSTAKDMNDLGKFEPLSTLEKDQSCSNEDGCLKNTPTNINKFLPSNEKTTTTTEYNDGNHRVSIDGSKATPDIEPLSFGQDMPLNNHPAVGCGTSNEGFNALHPNREMTHHTMTMEQQLLEAVQPLKSPAPRKKKLINRVVKVGVSMIQQTCNSPVNGNAVSDLVLKSQPLEDKDQAGDINISTAMILNDLGQFEPFLTLDKDQSRSDEDGWLKDTLTNINKFLPSTENTTATTEYNDGDHQVSIDESKATLGIEPLSSGQDMASNNHPPVHCDTSAEEFEVMYSSMEKSPPTMPLRLLEAMQHLHLMHLGR